MPALGASPVSPPAHRPSAPLRTGELLHAIASVALLSMVVAPIAAFLTALAWDPPYDPLSRTPSDLGITTCFRNSAGYLQCSPAHLLINAAFTYSGVAWLVGACLWRPFRGVHTTLSYLGRTTSVGAAFSLMFVGTSPEDLNLVHHRAAAFCMLVLGAAALLLTGFARRAADSRTGPVLLALGAITAVSTVLVVVSLSVTPTARYEWGGLAAHVATWPIFVATTIAGISGLRTVRR